MSSKQIMTAALGIMLVLAGTAAAQVPGGRGPGGRGGRGGPPGRGPGGPGGPGGRGDSAQLLDDLKLSDSQLEKARTALRAHDQKMRQLALQARQELVGQMKDVLTPEQLTQFTNELDQVPLLPPVRVGARGIPTDDLISRLTSFDANKDGKVTKDELPERMQFLVDQGDTNKDGCLDTQEIKDLAARSSVPTGRGGRGPGGGPGGRGGRGGPGGPGGRGFPPPR